MFSIETSWPDVQAYFKTNDSVMIITGSLECHGVHNPLGVDTLVPEALAQRIEKQTEILVLPALLILTAPVIQKTTYHWPDKKERVRE